MWRSQKDDRQATGQRRSNTFGIYFSEDKESTKIYGNKTKPYYVNLKNPIILKDKEWNLSIITRPTLYGLEQKGYDGAIWLRNGVMYEVVAFSPDQVVALEDFKEPLNEGSYTQIVSALARNILNDWKNQFEQAKGSKIEQVENFFTVGKGQDIPTDKFPGVIQVASYLYFDNDQVDLEVSADADPDFNDKDRGQVADIEINFAISPDSLPGYWEEIYMNLVEVLRHEIEHTTQTGPNVKPGKYLPSDEELRGAIEMGVMKPVNYFLLPKEIPAMIQGMYMAAKKRRVPFKDFVNQSLQYYVDGEYLKPKDVQTILNVWRKHLPKLGIKQEL